MITKCNKIFESTMVQANVKYEGECILIQIGHFIFHMRNENGKGSILYSVVNVLKAK